MTATSGLRARPSADFPKPAPRMDIQEAAIDETNGKAIFENRGLKEMETKGE